MAKRLAWPQPSARSRFSQQAIQPAFKDCAECDDRKDCCYPGRRRSPGQCARGLNRRDPRPTRKGCDTDCDHGAPGLCLKPSASRKPLPRAEMLLGSDEVAAKEVSRTLSMHAQCQARGAAFALRRGRVSDRARRRRWSNRPTTEMPAKSRTSARTSWARLPLFSASARARSAAARFRRSQALGDHQHLRKATRSSQFARVALRRFGHRRRSHSSACASALAASANAERSTACSPARVRYSTALARLSLRP